MCQAKEASLGEREVQLSAESEARDLQLKMAASRVDDRERELAQQTSRVYLQGQIAPIVWSQTRQGGVLHHLKGLS